MSPCLSGPLDELYPSLPNIVCISVHLILGILQLAFLISIPVCLILLIPCSWFCIYVLAFLVLNRKLCDVLLNGPPFLESKTDLSRFPSHENERWIFLNGVAAGATLIACHSHSDAKSLESIIRRGSIISFIAAQVPLTNPKWCHGRSGILFDVIQCLIQRCFCYPTQDVRDCYVKIKDCLLDEKCTKLVLVLHSQGGIEGGLILDWLFGDVPSDLTRKMEVYTFGNAANHFSNPHQHLLSAATASHNSKAIRHIEHYANEEDFVSCWGVLQFTSPRGSSRSNTNRFMGRVFIAPGGGHQFNQHYLDPMFPLDQRRGFGVLEHNRFMDNLVRVSTQASDGDREDLETSQAIGQGTDRHEDDENDVVVRDLASPVTWSFHSSSSFPSDPSMIRVRDVSRLWAYRNGKVPFPVEGDDY
ncbi:MAG: hypothetical protein MMC33_005481 [Icmadophila ericetorum]|nr:hypothetical protein [Icmadophila ericetorum]